MKKLLTLFFVLLTMAAFGHDNEPPAKLTAEQVYLRDLNARLQNQAMKRNEAFIRPDAMLDLKELVSTAADNDRNMAGTLMGYLDSHQDKLKEELQWDDLVILPVGLKKKVGTSVVTVGILRAEFFPQHAELTVFIRLTTPVNGNSTVKERDLFFGVEKLKFTKQNGLSAGGFKAVLLGDYLLPMKDWTVYLKGGLNKSESPSNDDPLRTYVQFDCGKFDKLNVAAKIVIPRSKLLPCTPDGKVITSETVRVTVDGLRFTSTGGLRDVLFDTGVITPFALPKHPEYAYKVSNLAFDLSDVGNPTTLGNTAAGFPPGYDGDTDDKWQGLYLKRFEIIMPEEFQDDADTTKRVNIDQDRTVVGAENVLWDRTGFTGHIFFLNLNKKVNAKKWKLTLDNVDLVFLQGKFKSGSFDGGLETPVQKPNASSEELFSYKAEVFLGQRMDGTSGERSNYNLTVNLEKNVPLDFMFAKGRIDAGSTIFLSLEYTTAQGYKFKPRAVLSGAMEIGVHTQKGNQGTAFAANKGVSFGKVVFRELVLQTVKPYVSIGGFDYEQGNNNFLVNFPIQIKKFEKSTGPDPNRIYTTIGVELSLLKDKIGGATELRFASEYNGNGKLRPVDVDVRKILIRGDLPTVGFDGFVDIGEDDTKKEVRGGLKVTIKKPSKFEVGVSVLFGNNKVQDYKYGFVDVYALMDGNGVNMGPVNLYGAGIAVYWNMVVSDTPCPGGNNTGCYEPYAPDKFLFYKIDQSVKFGLKLMAAIKDPGPTAGSGKSSFKARVYLDVAIKDDWSIKHIGIYGTGVIAGNFGDGDTKASMVSDAKATVKLTGSNDKSTTNQDENAEKQKAISIAKNGNESPNPSTGAPTGMISFNAGILMDFERKIFDLRAEAYMKTPLLAGIGTNNKLGKVEMHFEKNNNYLYVGKSPKEERVGIKIGDYLKLDAYLMIGKGVTAFPMPDPAVLKLFPSLKGDPRFSVPSATATQGGGFAFGASLMAGINKSGKRWYAKGVIVAGLDVIITNASTCSPNNWFGQGQVYGAVNLDAGYKNKKNTRYIRLITAGMGIYAYIQAPDPFGMEARVAFNVPGWIPGERTKEVGFKIGQNCLNP